MTLEEMIRFNAAIMHFRELGGWYMVEVVERLARGAHETSV